MRAFLLSILSGVLLALSLPPLDLSFLAWFALAPLLVVSRKLRVLEAGGCGLVVGLVAGVIHARFSGGLFLVFAYAPFLWFGVLCATFAVVANRLRDANVMRRVVMLACIGVLAEWLTTLTPLPINFAVTQHRVLALIQIADITGIWGVSFGLWLCNAAIAELWPRETGTSSAKTSSTRCAWRNAKKTMIVAACWLSVSSLYGAWKLSLPLQNSTLRVAAVQAFEPNGGNGFADAVSSDARLRETLTRKAVAQGAKIVVWSEENLGSDFQIDKTDDISRQLARQLRTTLVAGFIEERGRKQWNSAALISPRGEVLGVHRKIHLYAGERATTTAGATPTVVDSDLGKIGMAICFDTCWTNVLREEANNGAQMVVMPNFDPPVPRGVVHYLHGAMLPFRAVENRVLIVRADPNGHSGVITSQGRVLEALPLQSAGVSVQNVSLGDGQGTVFSRFGEWLVWLCGAILVGFALQKTSHGVLKNSDDAIYLKENKHHFAAYE